MATLAALADADVAALADAVRRVLRDGGDHEDVPSPFVATASSQEADDAMGEHAPTSVVAKVLAQLNTRANRVAFAVATSLVSDDESTQEGEVGVRHRELLSGLLQQATQRLDEPPQHDDDHHADDDAALTGMLVAYAACVATQLTREETTPERVKMLVTWADRVVDLAVRLPGTKVAGDASATATPWVVQLASEFYRIHQHSADIRVDFRVMTVVWKNLNKLASVHRSSILGHVDTSSGGYTFGAAFEAAATSLARSTQRLRATTLPQADHEVAAELKLLRLFLRAFQGQFVQFVDAMVAQVECSVALAVDAIAAVIPIAEGHVTESEKTQHEAIRVLQCVISFVETMGKSEKLQASTRSFVGAVLWQSSDKMITLLKQTRSQYVDTDEGIPHSNDSLLQWGHLLALAAFYAIHGDVDVPTSSAQSGSISASIVPEFCGIAGLFNRFRAWGAGVMVGEFTKTINLFVDITLDLMVAQATTTAALQLFLVEQTLHPEPTQRFLMWEFWRELLCFVWEENVVSAAINTLVQLTYTKDSNGALLHPQVREEILHLLAFVYPELCGSVQEEYLRIVSSAFDVVCAEGPGHKFTPQLATSFDLLELLATSSLLVEYSQPDKEDWIAHYLPVAMECIGGIHDMLEQGQLTTSTEKCAVLRALDASLLIVRAIFEDNDKSDFENAQGLGGMLLPMCTETVTHLARLVERSGVNQDNAVVSSRSFTRVLTNCLEILTVLAPMLKMNRSNQCVQVIKDLLTILRSDHELTPHAVAITIFIRDALADMCVMPSDADVVWKMLGCLFHKLSALHFGLQVDPVAQPLTPQQSVCLEAVYALLVRSNVPDFANRQRSFKSWVVPHAQSRLGTFVQMMCEPPQANADHKRAQCRHWYRSDRFEAAFRERFPSVRQQPVENGPKKREREVTSEVANPRVEPELPPHLSNSVENVDMDEEIEHAKRAKWDTFAATYWELHESLSSLTSPNLQEAFLDRLTESDLDQATSALKVLLQRNRPA